VRHTTQKLHFFCFVTSENHEALGLLEWRMKCLKELREDREKVHSEVIKVTKNVKGLLNVLRQSINEAILESNDVAAAMAALKRTGKCPVFGIDVALEEVPDMAAGPMAGSAHTEELVLSDSDVEFLAVLGITDPSWSAPPPSPVLHSTE
jgi:hypothetical protein